MTWEDIIKISSLEREIAEEYAPEDMDDFNQLNQLISLVKDLQKNTERQMASGSLKGNSLNPKIRQWFNGWLDDLEHLQREGRPQDRSKVKFGEKYNEAVGNEAFPPLPWAKQGWTHADVNEWRKKGHKIRPKARR